MLGWCAGGKLPTAHNITPIRGIYGGWTNYGRSRRTQGGRRVGFHGRKQDTGSVSRDIHRAHDEATVLVGTHPAACWMTFGWRSSIQCFISVLGGAAAYRCLFAPARLPRRIARAFGRHNARRETTSFCKGSAQVEETEREREGGKALRATALGLHSIAGLGRRSAPRT